MTKEELVKRVMNDKKVKKVPKSYNTWIVDVIDSLTKLVVAKRTGLRYRESFTVARELLADFNDDNFYCRIVSYRDVCDVRFVKMG